MATSSAQGMQGQGSMAQRQQGFGGNRGFNFGNEEDIRRGSNILGPQGPPAPPAGVREVGIGPQRPPLQGGPGGVVNPGGGFFPAGSTPEAGGPPAPPGGVPAQQGTGRTNPYTGTPVNPDGSFRNPDGSIDWMEGTGPQYNFGRMTSRTGRAPTSPAPPEPDAVDPSRGPRWRQAFQQHDAWIQDQLRAGLTLADLGFEPVRGGGLSVYMRYGGEGGQGDQLAQQGGAAGATPGAPAGPAAPGGRLPGRAGPSPAERGTYPQQPQGAGTGGYLPGTMGSFGGGMGYGGAGFGGGNTLQNAILQLLMGGGFGGGG